MLTVLKSELQTLHLKLSKTLKRALLLFFLNFTHQTQLRFSPFCSQQPMRLGLPIEIPQPSGVLP
jgi:hypothetical protein